MVKKQPPESQEKVCIVHHQDLPLSCPKDDVLWKTHPKIYLPIDKTGRETCPYCGTKYILQDD